MKRIIALAALGLAIEGLFLYLALAVGTDIPEVWKFTWLCIGAFVLHAGAVALLWKAKFDKRLFGVILFFAVAFRVTLVPVEGKPYYPDADAYRYLWDGAVTSHGLNPYKYSPYEVDRLPVDDPYYKLTRTEAYRAIFEEVEYKPIKTIYPPVSQFLFALAMWIAPGSFVFYKVLVLLLEFVTIGILCRLVTNPLHVVIYAWCPLVIEEFSYAGHHDAAAVCFLVIAVYFLVRSKPWLAGGFWGLAILAKVFPVVLLPVFLRKGGWKTLVTCAGVSVVLYLPFLGGQVFSGLGEFAERWRFNAGIFQVVENLTSPMAARWICGSLVLGVAALVSFRKKVGMEHALLLLCVLLLLSPVLDPWYVTWIVPFLCLFRWPSLMLLTGLVFIHYFRFRDPVGDVTWIQPLEFGVFYLALIVEICVRYKNIRDHSGAERGGGAAEGAAGDPVHGS